MILVRYAFAAFAALLCAVGLFWMMQMLITPAEEVVLNASVSRSIDFVRVKRQEAEPEMKKRLPPEPQPKPQPPTQTQKIATQSQTPAQSAPISAMVPDLPTQGAFAKGAALSMNMMQGDSELTPLVRIDPQYPPRARRLGIEGVIKAQILVDTEGKPKSIEIIESDPPGEFDSSVSRALMRWKFRPKIEGGVAMEYSGVVTILFSLNQ